MFRRRNPLNFFQNTRQALWPKMGWWRLVKYYRARVIRLSLSAESIAFNLAGGAAMSFTPFFGIHVLTALGFAWIMGMRMNLVAATVRTFVGNPWTFPFLFYAGYSLGAFILGFFDAHDGISGFSPETVEAQGENLLGYLWDNFAGIFIPLSIGGTILAIVSFPFYYYLFLYLVRGAQRARKLRMKRIQKARFNKAAGRGTKK
jgi:uncharacterized protein (DUF2062 family)